MIKVRGHECYPSRGVAVIIKLGRNTMLRELRSRGILNRLNLPTEVFSNKGYFIVQQTVHGPVTYYTDAGIALIKEQLVNVPRKVEKPYKCPDLPFELLND